MSKLLDEIHDYLFTLYPDADKEKVIYAYDNSTVGVASEIAEYAHRNQKQLNGKPYVLHCYECRQIYRTFVGIVENDPFCIDVDLMSQLGIPFEGVQEVCMLHDVLEDTALSMADVESIFEELDFGAYFKSAIMYPLAQITHDITQSYDAYAVEVLKSQTAAMVKFADLVNNLDLSRLTKFDEEETSRIEKYVRCFATINGCYHFLEKAAEYRKRFADN